MLKNKNELYEYWIALQDAERRRSAIPMQKGSVASERKHSDLCDPNTCILHSTKEEA